MRLASLMKFTCLYNEQFVGYNDGYFTSAEVNSFLGKMKEIHRSNVKDGHKTEVS